MNGFFVSLLIASPLIALCIYPFWNGLMEFFYGTDEAEE